MLDRRLLTQRDRDAAASMTASASFYAGAVAAGVAAAGAAPDATRPWAMGRGPRQR